MKITCKNFENFVLRLVSPKYQGIFCHHPPQRSMASNRKGGIVAVCQMTSTNNIAENFTFCKNLVEKASSNKAQVVFLPEACDYVGENLNEIRHLSEPLDGSLISKYCTLAKDNNIWISLGGIHEKVSDTKLCNAHVMISNEGDIASVYRKTHLFDVDLPEKKIKLQESAYVEAGKTIENPIATPVGKIGLGICYDMRFPEMSILLRKKGAEILTYPSCFTVATGASHWEVLLRCRAIENQCYVVAAAQIGQHNKKRSSYGHAMIVDPWGTIVAQCDDKPDIAFADVSLDFLENVRKEMPVAFHKRPELYSQTEVSSLPSDDEKFQFGQVVVQGNTVFYKTQSTIAFTNKKCVVPGHVLVAPIKVAKRVCDLAPYEVADLFQVVQKVQATMETIYGASSSTLTVQDGPDAGQTIQQVHVHVLPRKHGDFFNNDEIYYKLQMHDKIDDKNPWRSEEEMQNEAEMIKKAIS